MEFDYVIVGGGSAGATLAARLSEHSALQVCLIEAGGDGKDILVRAPAGVIAMVPGRPKINNYAYETVPQAGLNGRRGYQPRGRCLGGSSAINAMLYVRGQPQDYDEWERLGCTGWGFQQVLPYFIKAEANQRGADVWHGGQGPLQVANQQTPRGITADFVQAAQQCGYPFNPDFNGPVQEGVGYYQVTQFHGGSKNGQRCSAAAAYLHPVMSRPNLTVLTATQALKVVFDGRRAAGVKILRQEQQHIVRARREVLLCGGAFNSPQLLLLSGVGDPAELQQHGIPLRHALPGVGKNLQDHLDYILCYRSDVKDVVGLGALGMFNMLRAIRQWRKTGQGMIATPFAEGGAFLKSAPELERPDLQLHFVISIVDDHARKLHYGYGYSCHVCVLRPVSRGTVTLASADPLAAPQIDPRFLSAPEDLALLMQGARQMQAIMQAPALARHRPRSLYPVPDDDRALEAAIRARADTIYHPVGTCKMGMDAQAVVDPQFRVHGLQGLRVVDASVFPTLISGNTNAPTIMLAERAAEWLVTDR
ncbi:glucose-methanol-choline oxidoreductase [Pseudoduganella sp. FT93W]|uniref:Glucose-methanol-choline oxidoreductase n=1 Tax=Duganella fentianensis TaxID=2692177 RepID=A0A845HYD3_9BURK|nr:GMC family oxidoreductase N-terminal domain-containing protein [Duganella fentianensis]MYN45892.1 glucose-methanol-choline oxidoreductase [Duganella fentianensis]